MKKVKLPSAEMRAMTVPTSINEELRTVEVVFSTGAKVFRQSWDGPFYEELEISEQAVKMDRLRKGAPVLKDHDSSLDSMVGVVESAEIRNGEAIAVLRFSKREDVDRYFQDIKEGIIRNISVGYVRNKVILAGRENDIPVYRATEWEPFEISILPIPADSNAQVRALDQKLFDCEITNTLEETEVMKVETNTTENRGIEAPSVDVEKLKLEAVMAERKRQSDIREACKLAKVEIAEDLIERGLSADEARKEVLAALAKTEVQTRSAQVQVGANLEKEGVIRGMSEVLCHRARPQSTKLTDVSNSFRFFKLADMAKYILRGQGVAVDFLSPMDLAGRALHSTSDFVKVLENVANKTLRDAYQESPQTFNAFTRRVENSDFKEISRVQLGDFPKFQEKTEGGEYVYGTVGEGAEKYKIKTYGVIVGLTREALINDDLNSFARVPDMAGRQAANLESDLVYAILNSNPTMADGFALFSSQHANLASGGDVGAPSVTTLGVAREAMRLQKSLNGSHLNLVPVSLIVPANHETAADQIVTQITPAQTSNVNPFAMAGRTPLSPVVEPRLDATSVNAWYLAAAISQVDIIELCTMTGEAMPVIDSMVDFDTDGVKFKARHTVGTKAIDYRGIYKNPGV